MFGLISKRPATPFGLHDYFIITFVIYPFILTALSSVLIFLFKLPSFSARPFVSAGLYGIFIIIIGVASTEKKYRLFSNINPWIVLYFMCISWWALYGILFGNKIPFILSWSVYYFYSAIAIMSVLKLDYEGVKSVIYRISTSNILLAGIILLSVVSLFSDSVAPILDYISFPLFFTRYMIKKNKFEILIFLFCIAISHLNHNPSWRLDVSRSFIIMVLVFIGITNIYNGKSIKLVVFFALFLAVLGIGLSMDEREVRLLPRNVAEGLLILRGDRIKNFVATEQRFYEIQLVEDDYKKTNILTYFYGQGFGKTLDMRMSLDDSLKDTALEGASSVNNVHFLPVAIFHKTGIAGLLFVAVCLFYVLKSLLFDLIEKNGNAYKLFCYLFLLCNFAYAFSASNYFIAEPFVPLVFAMLVVLKRRDYAARPYRRSAFA